MKFQDFVCRESLVANISATESREVVEEMMNRLAAAGRVPKKSVASLVEAVMQREQKGSTGFGNGVAIPHVKQAEVKNLVGCVGRSEEGIEFNALDSKPVHLFFLLISPKDKPAEHLKAMEKIFRSAQKEHWRRFLKQANTEEGIWELLIEADEEALV